VTELPSRPEPPVGLAERVVRWIRWVGPGRVALGVGSSLAAIVVVWWLLQPPRATTESMLPVAVTDGVSVSVDRTAPSTVAASLVVHVAGAVVEPGVLTLPEGSRVVDAVQAAGGATPDAAPDQLNLAAAVRDGQRIYVPRVGEQVPSEEPSGISAGPVDLNTASASDLDELPGIGPSLAAAIVSHREQHGRFTSVEQLAEVPGIGEAKLAVLRGLVTV